MEFSAPVKEEGGGRVHGCHTIVALRFIILVMLVVILFCTLVKVSAIRKGSVCPVLRDNRGIICGREIDSCGTKSIVILGEPSKRRFIGQVITITKSAIGVRGNGLCIGKTRRGRRKALNRALARRGGRMDCPLAMNSSRVFMLKSGERISSSSETFKIISVSSIGKEVI